MSKLAPFFPAFIYISGIGALLAIDITITTNMSAMDVSQWANIRSLVGIASIICLAGLDQTFIRSPNSSKKILKAIFFQIPLISLLLTLLASQFNISKDLGSTFFICAGSAAALALSQYYRALNKKLNAQLLLHSWKYPLLAIIIASIYYDYKIFINHAVACVLLIPLAALAFILLSPRWRPTDQTPETLPNLYKIGFRFLCTSTLLAIATYAEQLVVSGMGKATEAAEYFTHTIYFLFPITIINGYVGFNIGPWIRNNHSLFLEKIKSKKTLIILLTLLYACISNLAGWVAWIFFLPSNSQPDAMLQAIFGASCIVRTLYIVPAGYLGIFGSFAQHDRLILLQILALFFSGIIFFILTQYLNMNILHATAVASTMNWTIRLLSSNAAMRLANK